MTTNAEKLFAQALTLEPADRAELAAQLLASLDDVEADVESAWATEIERRAADARQNPDDDEDWRTVLNEGVDVAERFAAEVRQTLRYSGILREEERLQRGVVAVVRERYVGVRRQ